MIQQCHHAQSLSRVQFFATPWTVAHKDPLFTGFSKQEYWRGLLFPSGNAISWYILKGNKNRILKRHLLLPCTCSVTYNSQDMETSC